MKDIDEYAEWAATKWYTSSDGASERDVAVMTLGLAGESGEVVEIIKKKIRDGVLDVDHLKSELGDVIYYWARICGAFGVQPSSVLKGSMEKLKNPRLKMTRDELRVEILKKIENRDSTENLADALIMMVLNSGVKK